MKTKHWLYLLSVGAFVGGWAAIATQTKPIFFPSPLATFQAALELLKDGSLLGHIQVSILRILIGWVIGGAIGVPLGLIMGEIRPVRQFVEPYIEFFRFIPPISLVTLSMIWFGMGETSKIALIIYTSVFLVVVNSAVGVMSVRPVLRRAASSLGASKTQIFFHVVLPSAVPYLVTGMRLAMGNSFMTIVAAEMIAAQRGIGFLIFNSRLFMLTDRIFVGIIVLGVMGFIVDRAFRFLTRRFARPYLFSLAE